MLHGATRRDMVSCDPLRHLSLAGAASPLREGCHAASFFHCDRSGRAQLPFLRAQAMDNSLLAAIQAGRKLKKASVVNDRSIVAGAGGLVGEAKPAAPVNQAPPAPSGGGGMPGPGGLFAGGFPQLKKTGRGGGGGPGGGPGGGGRGLGGPAPPPIAGGALKPPAIGGGLKPPPIPAAAPVAPKPPPVPVAAPPAPPAPPAIVAAPPAPMAPPAIVAAPPVPMAPPAIVAPPARPPAPPPVPAAPPVPPAPPAAPAAPPAPPAPPARPVGPALPPDWMEMTSRDGRTYYHNPKTGETTWELPSAAAPPRPRTPPGNPAAGGGGAAADPASAYSFPPDGSLPPVPKLSSKKKVYPSEHMAGGGSAWAQPTRTCIYI